MAGVLYISADNSIVVDEVKNTSTDAYVNSGATVTFTLYRTICTDAVTISASATMTAASAPFVSGDASRSVIVKGAGTSGSDLRTTISTFTSSSEVTLGTTAGTSTTKTKAYISVANATTVSMSYVTGSNGKYRGTLDDDVVLAEDEIYRVEISIDAGSDVKDFRSFDVIAKYRE